MLGKVFSTLDGQPFVLLFLLVAAGYALGRLKVKSIGLGATAATLLLSLGVSFVATRLYGVTFAIPEFASTIFFNLFMFSVGMKVGPQFISGLRRDAKSFVILGTMIPLLALGLIFVVRAIFHPSSGLIPGIFAGANTATPGLGSARAAFERAGGELGGASASEAVTNMSTAFAFSYCVSMILFILGMKVPDALGANTARAARSLEEKLRGASDAPLPGTAQEFFSTTITTTEAITLRTYALQALELIGIPLRVLRATYPLVSVERIVRNGQVIQPADETLLRADDAVTLYGPIERLAAAGGKIGPEIYDRVARDIGAQTVDVVIHGDKGAGRSLEDLAADVGHGLHLNALFRGGEAIPFGRSTILQMGDILRVTGSKWRIETLEKEGGKVIRPSLATDIATLALGLTAGGLVGMITIPIGSVRIVLGSAVGLLLVGIALSTIRTRYPAFGGPYPEPARQLIEDLGLNVFIAILGLNAGAGVLKAISQGAVMPIVVGTLLVGFVPAALAWVVGTRLLKMNSALLLGAVAGGRCNSAGMRAAQESSASAVPAISYPVTFAVSNILFTVLSYVMALID